MVIRVYLSGISASKEVKKRQQRALLILDSLKVKYENIDITEPGHEEDRQMIRDSCKKRNGNSVPLPPQFFNDDVYCGDWFDFETASDEDNVLCFLKLEESKPETVPETIEGETKNVENDSSAVELKTANGELSSEEQQEEITSKDDVQVDSVKDKETKEERNYEKTAEAKEAEEAVDEDKHEKIDVKDEEEGEQNGKKEQISDSKDDQVESGSVKDEKFDEIGDDDELELVETNKEVTIHEFHNVKRANNDMNIEKSMEVDNEKEEGDVGEE